MNRPDTTRKLMAKAIPYRLKVPSSQGFTLAELMVVVTIMAILSAILLPALNKGKTRSQAISCLNNLRQLQLSWQMFPDDHNGELSANDYVDGIKLHSAQTYMGESWAPGNPEYDFTSENLERGHLFQYNRNPNIYRCPADKSVVELPTGSDPILRTRSYSMSSSMNSQVALSRFPSFRKQSEMTYRNTSRLFVFIDAHEKSITDAHFAVNPKTSPFYKQWVNLPTDRHGQAANLSFADGHIERWSWAVNKTWTGWNKPAQNGDERDLERLQSAILE